MSICVYMSLCALTIFFLKDFLWLLVFPNLNPVLLSALQVRRSYYLLFKESCAEQIKAWLEKMNDKPTHASFPLQQNQPTKYGLIIDALEFLDLAKSCETVVCCRAAPVQKVCTTMPRSVANNIFISLNRHGFCLTKRNST